MSRQYRRTRLAGLAALAGLGGLLAAGCSHSGAGSAAPGGLEQTNLNVAAVPALDSAALYIAQQRGLFAAEGLHVTILKAISGATALKSQLQGQFAVTVGNYVSYIQANAKNPKDGFRVLSPGSIMQPDNQEIVVPAGSGISTVSQLAGKTIGVNVTNNIGTLLVKSVLADNAVTGKVNFKAVQFPDMANALQSHEVQAAWLPEPFVTQDEESIGAQPLVDLNQGSTQNLPISGYMVTQSWLDKNPNTAKAFRAAILKAQAIAATDPAAVQKGMEDFAGTPAETAAIANSPEYPTAQSVTLLQRLANLMLSFNMLQQRYDVGQMIPRM